MTFIPNMLIVDASFPCYYISSSVKLLRVKLNDILHRTLNNEWKYNSVV